MNKLNRISLLTFLSVFFLLIFGLFIFTGQTVNESNLTVAIKEYYENENINEFTNEPIGFYFDKIEEYNDYTVRIVSHNLIKPDAVLIQSNKSEDLKNTHNIYYFKFQRTGINSFEVIDQSTFFASKLNKEEVIGLVREVENSTDLSIVSDNIITLNNSGNYKSDEPRSELQEAMENLTNEQKQCEEDYINGIISAKEYRDCQGLGW